MSNHVRTISPELVNAYREAIYLIFEDGQKISIKADQSNPDLAKMLRERGIFSAAFLTAFNPYSSIASKKMNELNQNSLITDLEYLGCDWIAGEGQDIANIWPSEPSILALDISLQSAELLADRYEQNAFLWITGEDGFVSLNLRWPVAGSNP